VTLAAKLNRLGMTGLADGWQPAEDRNGRYVEGYRKLDKMGFR
jgi:hypothetical protein